MRVELVLPCLNEAEALPWVLSRVPDGVRAIVVDNGSTDGSAQVAARLGATVVLCAQRGYGAACRAGLAAASAEFVAFSDCDATLDPSDVLRLIDVLERGADLAVARRRPTSPRAWPLHARIANRELARRVRRHTAVELRDLGPMRAARREAYVALDIADTRCGYPVETIVRAARAGWRIEQVDVAYTPRIGTSKVTGTWRGAALAVRDMSAALRA
jgi:glycosyltransferase involved in cell wall biosynthesis